MDSERFERALDFEILARKDDALRNSKHLRLASDAHEKSQFAS